MKPSTSTIMSAGIGVPLATIIAWAISLSGIEVPGGVEAALGAVLGAGVGYFFNGGKAADTEIDPNNQAGFARPLMLVVLTGIAALAMGLLQGCVTTPDGGRELSATGKVALQEVATIATRRYLRDHVGRATEIAANVRAVAAELQKATSESTLSSLRAAVEAELIERVGNAEDLQDAHSLLNIFEALLREQIGNNELDSAALVRVNEFAAMIVQALPAAP